MPCCSCQLQKRAKGRDASIVWNCDFIVYFIGWLGSITLVVGGTVTMALLLVNQLCDESGNCPSLTGREVIYLTVWVVVFAISGCVWSCLIGLGGPWRCNLGWILLLIFFGIQIACGIIDIVLLVLTNDSIYRRLLTIAVVINFCLAVLMGIVIVREWLEVMITHCCWPKATCWGQECVGCILASSSEPGRQLKVWIRSCQPEEPAQSQVSTQ